MSGKKALGLTVVITALFLLLIEPFLFASGSLSLLVYPICILIANWYVYSHFSKHHYLSFLFVLMLWVNYSVLVLQFNLIADSYNGLYASLNGSGVAQEGMRLVFFFMLSMAISLAVTKPKLRQEAIQLNLNTQAYICSIGLIAIFLAISMDYILGLGTISKSIYEYSIIFLIFAIFLSSGCSTFLHKVVIAIGVFGVFGNFLAGDRIVGLQFAIVLYLTYFKERINKFTMIAGVAAGVSFLFYSGANRTNLNVMDLRAIWDSSGLLFDRLLTLDTSFSAYFTSLRVLEFMQTLTYENRLEFFLHFLGALVAGGAYPYAESNLALYTHSLGYVHSFGMFLPLLVYFYLDYFGVFLLAIGIGRFVKIYSFKEDVLSKIILVYFCATFFRWYLYSPTMLFRGIVFIVVLYAGVRIFVGVKRRRIDA